MGDAVVKARALLASATQGPWKVMRSGNQYTNGQLVGASEIPQLPRPWNPHAIRSDDTGVSRFTDADADLIAAAPTLLAALADEAEQLREQVSELIANRVNTIAAGMWQERADKAEAERDRLRAMLNTAAERDRDLCSEVDDLRERVTAQSALIAEWDMRCLRLRDERDRLRAVVEAAVSDLSEHVEDGCVGPRGDARRGACPECALAERLASALDAAAGEERSDE